MEVTITYLQMFSRPAQPNVPLPEPLLALRSQQPTAAFYRFLYGAVGGTWKWVDRTRWSDEQLLAALRPAELWVLYYAGTPAGYCELVRSESEVNVSYFGLMPEFLGRGLGRLWLGWTHRVLLPAVFCAGGCFLVLCDLVARLILAPAELPIGIVTALLGGPFFLWTLFTATKGGDMF